MKTTLRTLLPLLLAGLAGCSYITHDRSKAPGMDALVGRSFVTVQDAFLISDACLHEYAAKQCAQLQAARGYYYSPAKDKNGWVPMHLPADAAGMAGFPEAARLTWVPRGTELTVTQVISKSLGFYRRCWLVYGRVAGMPEDAVAELPTCFQWAPESEPPWLHAQALPADPKAGPNAPTEYDYIDKPPVPDPALLAPARH